MFELSVACKYLIPRRRQLSVSIISLISVLVIALVVWLVVVFFSVTDGLEKNWVQKLTALTAPVRISPTDAYYHSYYYLIDTISAASNYSAKSIGEKSEALASNPYNPHLDEEIPAYWPPPDRDGTGHLKDIVKLAFASLDGIKNVSGLQGSDFELTASHIQLQLIRPATFYHSNNVFGGTNQSSLSYPAYLGNFEGNNSSLRNTLLDLRTEDLHNLFSLLDIAPSLEEGGTRTFFAPNVLHKRLKHFFGQIEIAQFKTGVTGWNIPRKLLPENGTWQGYAILNGQEVVKFVVPLRVQDNNLLQRSLEEQGLTITPGKAALKEGVLSLSLNQEKQARQTPSHFTLTLAGGTLFSAQLDEHSAEKAKRVKDLVFNVEIPLQGHSMKGKISSRGLEIGQAKLLQTGQSETIWWIHPSLQSDGRPAYTLPHDPDIGEGIALPRSFRDAGVLIGDRGWLSYYSPTASILQEQQKPVFVAGFYDPGIIPIGGKYILANREVTALIRASHQQDDKSATTNGINVRFEQLAQADLVKQQLVEAFKRQGVNRYWNVETYREYEFTKEIMHELQSQKHLFMLIAVVIILVACSNIVSMLIILVNDKKNEIGIMRSMGATSRSIALIFGMAGAMIGLIGSAAGILASILTLSHLDKLIGLLSQLQGHEMFSANVYGQTLPHELSYEALGFVLLATVCISLLAGIVPAIKACLLRPSQILRAGGS